MTPPSPSLGLYIHIPFCHARCGYCDFVTFTGKEDRIEAYVNGLRDEMGLYRDATISTIFFGGGTPSLLESHHLQTLFQAIHDKFRVVPDAEITLEANPESVTAAKARAWKDVGINRVSIGLQVFDDVLLKKIDRLHTVKEFLSAFETVRQSGFDNISVDLIYGFEGQTLESWQDTLKSTLALGPEHLSLYALKIEAHTPFAAQGMRVNDDMEAAMYEWARGYLKEKGYDQYEISNFARPGRTCRHNLIYWRQQDYLGLGVGAVGCVGGLRWENQKTLQAYHQDVEAGRRPRGSSEQLDPKTKDFERLMLGLRLREGLEWVEKDPQRVLDRASLAKRGLLEEIAPNRWRIPDAAIAVTNQVLLPFLT